MWIRKFFLSLLQPSGSGLSSINGFRLTMHKFLPRMMRIFALLAVDPSLRFRQLAQLRHVS